MKSRASFFNFTMLRKQLIRCIPLMSVYALFWVVLQPLNFVTNYYYRDYADVPSYVYRHIMDSISYGTISKLIFAAAIAMVLFSYLYSTRSANMMHAFPVRREGLFLTTVAAGLISSVVPDLIITLLNILFAGTNAVRPAFEWFLLSTLQFVFFFGFAALIAQLVSHIIALPIVYFILNFAVVVLEIILRDLLRTCIYGLGTSQPVLMAFSPVVYVLTEGSIVRGIDNLNLAYSLWGYHWIVFGVGIACLIAALLLYRVRKVETAGDAIAIPILRPVFKYAMTLGCAIVLGSFFYLLIGGSFSYGNVMPILLLMIAGAFIGYFGSEMALQKKFNVFKKEWLGFGLAVLAILAAIGLCRLDVFGYSSYVPAEEEIEGVYLGYDNEFYAESPQTIRAVRDLHQMLVDDHSLTTSDAQHVSSVYGQRSMTTPVTYLLKDGREITRTYQVLLTSDPASERYSFSQRFDEAYNLPEIVEARFCPGTELTRKNTANSQLEANYGNQYWDVFDLTVDETIDFYYDCVLPDLRDGLIGKDSLLDDLYAQETKAAAVDEGIVPKVEVKAVQATTSSEAPTYFQFNFHTTENGWQYYYFRINENCTRSYPAAVALWEAYKTAQAE